MWPPPGSCIKASPLMQPVAASPKSDLNTGVLLYRLLFFSGSRSNLIEIIYCFFIFLNHMLCSLVFFKDYSCFSGFSEISGRWVHIF